MDNKEAKHKDSDAARKTRIGDIRREELTLAALKCIAAKGYDRVTLDDVAKEAGLSQGIAFYYFKNREELLVSVIQKMLDNLKEVLREIWEIPEDVDDESKIYEQIQRYYSDPKIDIGTVYQEGITFLLMWFEKNPHLIKVVLEFWCQISRNPMITELSDSVQPYLRNVSSIILQEGMKRGTFKKRNPTLAAYTIFSAIMGLAFNHFVGKRDFELKKLEKECSDLIMDYLCV